MTDDQPQLMGLDDPYFIYDQESKIWYHKLSRDVDMDHYNIHLDMLADLVIVLEWFQKHQDRNKQIRSLELPVIHRIIRYHIFKERINRTKTMSLAKTIFRISILSDEVL